MNGMFFSEISYFIPFFSFSYFKVGVVKCGHLLRNEINKMENSLTEKLNVQNNQFVQCAI